MCSGNVGSRMTMFDAIYDREQKALLCGNPDCKAFLTRNVKEDCCRPGAAVAPRDACECVCSVCKSVNCCTRGSYDHDKIEPGGMS